MNRLRSLVLKNIWWKLLSFLIGVVIWFVGINISKPIDYQTFIIPISYSTDKLEASNLVLMNEENIRNTTITVKVSGRIDDMQTLTRDSFLASINLGLIETLTSETRAVLTPTAVSVDILENAHNFEIIKIEPSTVDVMIDRYEKTIKKINVVPTGEIAANYRAVDPVVEPEMVTIEGARSALNNIGSVRIDINISGATEDVIKSGKIKVYDVNDKEITSGLVLAFDEAEVKVPIYMMKEVPVIAPKVYAGVPREGYVFIGAVVEPATVQVIGSPDAVTALKSVVLEPANVRDQFATFKYTVDLHQLLPDDIEIINGTPSSVVVTVSMGEIITKTFTVPVSAIDIFYSLPYISVKEETLEVTLTGLKSLIDEISEDELKGKLYLTDYAEGEYIVKAEFDFDEKLTVSAVSDLTVKLSTQAETGKTED